MSGLTRPVPDHCARSPNTNPHKTSKSRLWKI
jgi:hypothetical protein